MLPLFLLAFFTGISQRPGSLVLKKGEKYQIENKFTVLSTQQMMGQSMDSKADIAVYNNFEVKDVKDNNYNVSNTITKVTATMNAMGQDINFDSDKKEDMNGEMGGSMKDIINQPKEMTVDKAGKIIASKDTAKKDAGGGMMSSMMQQFMGDPEKTGFGLSEAFMIIPASAAAGYNWTDSSSQNGISKSTTYTIKEIKGQDAVVGISGTINADTKTEMQGVQISSKTTGKITGEQTVDLRTGIIRQKTTNMESSGNMQAMGQDIPMTTKLTAVSTVKSL